MSAIRCVTVTHLIAPDDERRGRALDLVQAVACWAPAAPASVGAALLFCHG